MLVTGRATADTDDRDRRAGEADEHVEVRQNDAEQAQQFGCVSRGSLNGQNFAVSVLKTSVSMSARPYRLYALAALDGSGIARTAADGGG